MGILCCKKSRLIQLAALLAAAGAVAAVGCFPAKRAQAPAPGAVQDAEHAYWRGKYVRNRMVPPEHYSVMPEAPRNNEFGEFDDDMYRELDRQPELPALPGDAFADAGMYAMAAPGAGAGFGAAQLPVTSAPSGQQGVANAGRFFPVEQLVYGGDYADLDPQEAYRLMPKDEIAVTVRNHPEFSGKLELRPDGTVRIPNTPDPVHLRGMTADEAADEIRRNIAVYVRGDCVVRVQTNRARGGYYFVFGDVRQPGRFPMGMEPVRLSDAVMAANFEVSPARLGEDDELSPAFPAAAPRGAFLTPRTADMARVMLVTPHRSQPVRSVHDLRQAMLGMTAGDPLVRPGQIVIVPSLDPEKNLSLGLEMSARPVAPPPALQAGQGFSDADSPARLPEALPYAYQDADVAAMRAPKPLSGVEANMAQAYGVQANEEAVRINAVPYADEYFGESEYLSEEDVVYEEIIEVESVDPALPVLSADEVIVSETPVSVTPSRGRRLRRAPFANAPESAAVAPEHAGDGWKKGF